MMKQTTIRHFLLALALVLFTACGSSDKDTDSNPTQNTAIAKLMAYADSKGTTEAPTLQDFLDAGVVGVDENKLADINQVIANLTKEEVDTKEEVQVLADALGIDISATTSCKLSEGVPKTDSSLTVHAVCTSITANIQSAKVSLNSTTKPVDYTPTSINDYVGFTGLEADTAYTVTLEVTTNTSTLTKTVSITTKEKSVVVTPAAPSIIHNGTTYGTVTSPHTGKVWLDRNLGASQVCVAANDTACYGDYYQWGRSADGHQVSGIVPTIGIQATDVDNVGFENFIFGNNDWASIDNTGTIRNTNWSKKDGSSVCPIHYRVPTLKELQAELFDAGSAEIRGSDTAFRSFLKLPSAGHRNGFNAQMDGEGSWGSLWSNSIESQVYFDGSNNTNSSSQFLAYGLSVRCIKN